MDLMVIKGIDNVWLLNECKLVYIVIKENLQYSAVEM